MITLTYASVMKTPQPSFSRIVRESGTTLVVTMGLYLVPEQRPVASLLGNSYRQVMGPRRMPCGTILAHGTTIMELLRAVPIYSHPVATNAPAGAIELYVAPAGYKYSPEIDSLSDTAT